MVGNRLWCRSQLRPDGSDWTSCSGGALSRLHPARPRAPAHAARRLVRLGRAPFSSPSVCLALALKPALHLHPRFPLVRPPQVPAFGLRVQMRSSANRLVISSVGALV